MVVTRAVWAASALLALGLPLGVGWIAFDRNRELQRRLDNSQQQAEALGRNVQQYAGELNRVRELATSAKANAEEAARQALEAAAGRTCADERTRLAEEAKKHAEDAASQSRQELQALQERREQELNRMNEALAKITATRRTNAGLVIELADDSFHFDFDKADLRPENRELLSRIAGILLVSNGYRLFIHGHTDDVGSEGYNRQLSERRAESVASYLKSAGLDSGVIQTVGFGKSAPRAVGASSEARRKNRRVEIVLVDSIIHYQGEVQRGGKS